MIEILQSKKQKTKFSENKKPHVLVVGGAGYIGSVTVEQLVKAGNQVAVFDNLSQGHRAAVHEDAEFIFGDLANRDDVDSAISGFCPGEP